jgi:hypothetical protein
MITASAANDCMFNPSKFPSQQLLKLVQGVGYMKPINTGSACSTRIAARTLPTSVIKAQVPPAVGGLSKMCCFFLYCVFPNVQQQTHHALADLPSTQNVALHQQQCVVRTVDPDDMAYSGYLAGRQACGVPVVVRLGKTRATF